QQQILFGAWLAMFVGQNLLEGIGSEWAATALRLVWFGVVLLLSCTVPLFNLLLLLHPLGRHALDDRPRRDALVFGGAIAMLAGVGAHVWLTDTAWSQIGWIWFVFFLLPVAGLGNFEPGKSRRILQLFCAATLGFFVWWSVHLESLIATHRVDRDAPRGGSARALVRKDQPAVKEHLGLFGNLILITALSTWFVMLAPKGAAGRR
ncbi:MAG: hypothetical protein JNM84_01470, partial [Planctomycetes bacterium]|nr:hypothetical protein [Planctomycetota bacterium]